MDYTSFDYNKLSGIPSLTNLAYSLFYRENYSKRYETINASLEHRMDLATGLVLTTTIDGDIRREIENSSDFSIFFRNSKTYTDNFPASYDPDPDLTIYDDSKLLAGTILLEYTPEYYYRVIAGRKRYIESAWPTFFLSYKQSFPVASTGWADYIFLSTGLSQEMEVGLLSTLKYRLEGGFFLKSDNMHFSDFKNFKSSPVLLDVIGFEQTFMLLDYYRASTNNYFLEGHASLKSSYLLIKLLPWFSERLWNETISLAYLYTDNINNHIQLGYNLNDILFMMDFGLYIGFEDWKYYGIGAKVNFRF